jgi:CHAT domain-containing protein
MPNAQVVQSVSAGGLVFAALLCAGASVSAQTPNRQPSFVAPPRSIADITEILDQEKPDAARVERVRATADAEPPATGSPKLQGQFYFGRARARAVLGRVREAIADAEKAVSFGGDYVQDVSRYQQFLSGQYRLSGDVKRSIELDQEISRRFTELGRNKGRFFGSNLRTAIAFLALGDLAQAEIYVAKNVALLADSRKWGTNSDLYRSAWEAEVENGKGRVAAARGRYREAETAFRKAGALYRDALTKIDRWANPPPPGSYQPSIDFMLAYEGNAKNRQGRLTEAEADLRRALLGRLKAVGKYSPDTAQIVSMLAGLLGEQSRWPEAEKLAATAVEIYREIGYPAEATSYVNALNQLGATIYAQRRWDESATVFALADAATRTWDPERAASVRLGWSRIFTLYLTNKVDDGIALARELVAFQTRRLGDKHYATAMARAILASGLTIRRQDDEAMQEFRVALPVLIGTSSDTDDDDTTVASAADARESAVLEYYLALLSRNRATVPEAVAESFRIGEAIRGGAVEKALAASSARLLASDPALAELVRKEQDLRKEIGAQLGALNNMLGLRPAERDDKAVAALRSHIEKQGAARIAARRDIERRFPTYADLVSPKPSTVHNVRAALRPDEAFVSFYFGRRNSFVWAVPQQGPAVFAYVPFGAQELNRAVVKLREALEPQAATVADIPPFDLVAAHDLYTKLLRPVERGWKNAKHLVVVTNGALGLLPLGLLPTAPAQIKADDEPLFADYRNVPWLARTHAVTLVPSAASLRTLRQLPAGKGSRERLIAFGDPLFNPDQITEASVAVAESATATRGIPLRRRAAPQFGNAGSATIASLPRLPDTAEEVASIALALEADPARVLHLGKAANEQVVKSADLSKYRIIVFATHGLVPGELDGLRQPALALSAPEVAGVAGDGLLTMEEILGLKLDADWVVLSACNTGAGAGAGAEAASGLGRAFFYAGTRALLVTNWSVHSASARLLVSDLFRRGVADPKLTRGEILRQASMALADGPGYMDETGKTVFAYAHPLFWAPYTIIGDGAGAQ